MHCNIINQSHQSLCAPHIKIFIPFRQHATFATPLLPGNHCALCFYGCNIFLTSESRQCQFGLLYTVQYPGSFMKLQLAVFPSFGRHLCPSPYHQQVWVYMYFYLTFSYLSQQTYLIYKPLRLMLQWTMGRRSLFEILVSFL